jgi:hypothetical protein
VTVTMNDNFPPFLLTFFHFPIKLAILVLVSDLHFGDDLNANFLVAKTAECNLYFYVEPKFQYLN